MHAIHLSAHSVNAFWAQTSNSIGLSCTVCFCFHYFVFFVLDILFLPDSPEDFEGTHHTDISHVNPAAVFQQVADLARMCDPSPWVADLARGSQESAGCDEQ